MILSRTFGLAVLLTLALFNGAWAAEAPTTGTPAGNAPLVTIELNKLETQDKACNAYFVLDNSSASLLPVLQLELVLFRSDGVIDRRLSVNFGPLRASKKSVKIFLFDAIACDAIGSLLVNDAMECQNGSGKITDCIDRLSLSSRAGVPFSK